MYVYIKFIGEVRVVSNVKIDDDCGPVVQDEKVADSPRRDESDKSASFLGKSTIDAIAWFKTLAMEAVYIDCGSRDVRWCSRVVTIRDSPPSSPVSAQHDYAMDSYAMRGQNKDRSPARAHVCHPSHFHIDDPHSHFVDNVLAYVFALDVDLDKLEILPYLGGVIHHHPDFALPYSSLLDPYPAFLGASLCQSLSSAFRTLISKLTKVFAANKVTAYAPA